MEPVTERVRHRNALATSKSLFTADAAAVLLLLSASVIIAWPRWQSGIDWEDEGLLAYGAIRVTDGQLPNRDFFSLQPPLPFYVAAVMFKMFGTSLGSLRILGLAIYLAIPLLLYGIARHVVKPLPALAAAVPAIVLGMPYFYFVPLAVWQGIAASLAAAFLFLEATLRGRQLLAVAAGILTAASILCRHDQGLYLSISLVVLISALRRAKQTGVTNAHVAAVLLRWVIGLMIVLLPAAIYWCAKGALPEMFRQLVYFPVVVYGKTSSLPFHHFNSRLPLSRNAVVALYYLPLIAFATAMVLIVRRVAFKQFFFCEAMLTFFLIWAVLFYFQVLTRSDIFHLLMTLPPFFLLAALLWDRIVAEFERNYSQTAAPKIVAPSVAAAGLVWFLYVVAPVALPDMRAAKDVLHLARGNVRVANAEQIAQEVETVQKHVPANRSILCLPYHPVLYFLCERHNPTHWNYLWPGDQTPEDHQTLISEARRDPPAAILIINEPKMASYAADILDYVHQEFEPGGMSGDMQLYVPRGEAHE